MKALVVATVLWLILIAAAASLGGLASFETGYASEIPKWNGWPYFFFCVREIGTLGAVVTFPIAVIVFFVVWANSGPRGDAEPDGAIPGPATHSEVTPPATPDG